MTYFDNVTSIAELKSAYKILASKHHPDKGGCTETMQAINAEYDKVTKILIDKIDAKEYSYESYDKGYNSFWTNREEHCEIEKKLREALQKIISLEGLEIEIIGVWIWVSGDTKPHKEALKGAGFKWNRTREMWLWIGKKSAGRGTTPLDAMRLKHGSQIIKTEKTERSPESKGKVEAKLRRITA